MKKTNKKQALNTLNLLIEKINTLTDKEAIFIDYSVNQSSIEIPKFRYDSNDYKEYAINGSELILTIKILS